MNEELALESFLDLTLTQHPRDKNSNREKCAPILKSIPLKLGIITFSLNSRTLVILLQVDPASSDELETICEGCYETEDTSIFAWSSIPGVGHYRRLHGPIH